ncbi:MAG TPA: glycoside hydrolase family 2 TIM barrel-domain containing protein [Thermoleophilaceae bacterium]
MATAEALPRPVALTHGWEFARGPHGKPQRGWHKVSVPHVFDGRPDPSQFHGTVGWYRLRFSGPATPSGFHWALHFGAVRREATAWLNGRRIGAHADPYAPFALTARGLRPRKVNELLVRVVNRKHAAPREGWWNWGGITRPVTLAPRGPVALDDIAVLPSFSCTGPDVCGRPEVLVRARVSGKRGPVRVKVTLRSPRGAVTSRTLRAHAPGDLSARFPLSGTADLWSPDHPALYSTSVSTRFQVARFETGVRSVQVKGGLLYLNGRRVQLRGASIEEDMPGRGPALRPSDIERIVAELKAVGANVTRAQYGLSDELMSALDRAGIMLWNQAPVYHRDVQLRRPEGVDAALTEVQHNIVAARNHASVLANSVDNEPVTIPDRRPGTRDFLLHAVKLAKALDPATPVAVDISLKPNLAPQRTLTHFDLLGLNSYFGWYSGSGPNSVANFADFAPTLQATRAAYPRQGLVVTEFGAEASLDGPADRKGSYAFQADYVNRALDVIDATPFLGGALYFTLRDFAVKPHWDGGAGLPVAQRTSIHHKGLLAYDGRPKPAWAAARQRFAATPLYVPTP